MGFIEEIKSALGNYVITEKKDLIPYMNDASYFTGEMPEAVVLPGSAEDVQTIMRLAYKYEKPVVVKGGGSSLTGSSILKESGIVMSMLRMNRILDINLNDKCVTVEPGLRLNDLQLYLDKYGHFYPPDPASSMAATVGGSISTNAGGLRGVAYGVTKDWILGLDVVLADGTMVKFGNKTLKRTLGYDLTSLMIGSEGTLGVITKAYLKIWPKPQKVARLVAFYQDIESAGRAVNELKVSTIPEMAEFLDKISLDSVPEAITYPPGTKYALIIDVSGPPELLGKKKTETEELLKRYAISTKSTTDPAEMEKIYRARKGLYASILKLRKSEKEYIVIGDIVVPVSELPTSLKEIEKKRDEDGVRAAIFGHIGDGNIHANIFADLGDNSAMDKVNRFMMDLAMVAVKHGGSVSAEHGIGIEKKQLLIEEMKYNNNLRTLDIMKAIKQVFDPKNILNRGNIFE
ncbi:glycolate oxidase subunit [Thermoplasma volcanium GSS1]|uniref:Glycolate oxidase subunit n=1 Tax=Thermoplasma volcanium (strain ATCC 51530 / DSM 4299 / JCM 9571 / NBRC 15438 / GSS1) TaxID=273116 RepID=Q97B62_THEVO|nr:FAD-binding oxidoreductase [Thermoplasma volcanium]BAB59738.1 glycolate oxidase subunit [Thermoplasma volcanium GSS1]